jgi:molecular chaperone DnaK (HSP70)
MGSTSTKASLFHFKTFRDSKTNKTVPQMQVLQVAWDSTLGGKQFDYRLAQYFVDVIKQKNHLDLGPNSNPRAFARILKESQRTKEILSANSEARVMVYF